MKILSMAGARVRSSSPRARIKRALAVGGSLAGAVVIASTFSLPAGATGLGSPANTTMIGSGSSTTYSMMQQLDVLFNSSPGCQQFVAFPNTGSPQPLDYSCTGGQQMATPENPKNDISVQEAAIGSSNGVQQLECQGAHGTAAGYANCGNDPLSTKGPFNVANNVSYARSSRATSGGDLKGLNFVAYAADAVVPFHYTKVIPKKGKPAAATPSAALTNLTTTQLADIYNGTLSNWNQVCTNGAIPPTVGSPPVVETCTADGLTGGSTAPIVVFSAQEGSGTESTFKTALGFDPSLGSNAVNCYTPSGGSKTCVGPGVIFENEDIQIDAGAFTSSGISSQANFVNANPGWGATGKATLGQLQADAIFYFSYGKYSLSCKVLTDCGGSPLNGNSNALMAVNGTKASKSSILEASLGGFDRFLYNVYGNGGNNANVPQASPAVANYVSEIGFICNPDKGHETAAGVGAGTVLDPFTGVSYLSEIQGVILASGFFPLSAGESTGKVTSAPIDEGNPGHPAVGYATDTVTHNAGGDPVGYCVVSNTDSNASS